MDGWTLSFILIFGLGAIVPAVWSIIGVIQGKSEYWPTIAGVIWAIVLLIFFFISMAVDWGGCERKNEGNSVICEASNCTRPDPWGDQCSTRCSGAGEGSYCPGGERPVYSYCEKISDGKIKQPWSTWSDLSFIAAGLWILWIFRFYTNTSTAPNPMRRIGWLSITYAMIIIFMGPASMLLHASMKNWAGWLDSMSVVIWLSFNAMYVFYLSFFVSYNKGTGILRRNFGVLLPTLLLVLFFGLVGWVAPEYRLMGFIVAGGLWGLFELFFLIRQLSWRVTGDWWIKPVFYKRTSWVFGLNFLILAITMTIWVLFNSEVVSAEFCQENESFPGHALFQILAAVATVLTYWSFATEEKITPQS